MESIILFTKTESELTRRKSEFLRKEEKAKKKKERRKNKILPPPTLRERTNVTLGDECTIRR